MPLAVKRLRVSDLPVEVTLSDTDAMMPEMKLSAFDLVVVGARISKTGNPVAQPGDLFVEVTGIDSRNPPQDLLLSINQVK
jgi:cytochrome c-type biogenesis protein CcmH